MPAAREGAMLALLDPKNDYVFKRQLDWGSRSLT